MTRILKRLADGRVFTTSLSSDKKTLVFEENCDNYFREDLTQNEVRLLAHELLGIADGMARP